MKFSIVVFLGLCAFATSSEIFKDIPDVDFITYEPIIFPRSGDVALPTAVNEYMKKSTMDFNGLVQKFKDLSNKIRNDVETYVAEKRVQVTEKATAVIEDIKDLGKQGAKYVECSKIHQNEVMDIANGVQFGIKECTTEIVAALKVFATEIASASTVLANDCMRLRELVLQCYDKSTIGTAKCVWDHFNEFKTVVEGIITGTKSAIDVFTVHGKELISSVKNCNDNHVKTSLVKFQSLKQTINECAKN